LGVLSFVKEVTNVVAARLGAVVSMVKLSTERLSLVTLPVVTLILQLEWSPSLKVLKVIVLLSAEAELSELSQSPL
jgi:hypothetical protein